MLKPRTEENKLLFDELADCYTSLVKVHLKKLQEWIVVVSSVDVLQFER